MSSPVADSKLKIPKTGCDLTKEWFEAALKRNITSVSVGEKGGRFSGFFGAIVVATVECDDTATGGAKETLKLAIKMNPQQEVAVAFVSACGCFEREVWFYKDFLPELQAFAQNNCKGGFKFAAPKCYYADIDMSQPAFVIVMENLIEAGYKNPDNPKKGLTPAEVSIVLDHLAQLYAASYAYQVIKRVDFYKMCPAVWDVYTKEEIMMKQPHGQYFLAILEQNGKSLEKLAAAELPEEKKLLEGLRKMNSGDMGMIYEKQQAADGVFSTLIHADPRMDNVMINRNEDGEIADLKFVDYQLLHNSPLTKDFAYIIYSSTNYPVSSPEIQEVLRKFYDKLVECIGNYKVDVEKDHGWSYDKFKESVRGSLLSNMSMGT